MNKTTDDYMNKATQDYLKAIKIYAMDDSFMATRTLHRLLNQGFNSFDIKFMVDVVKKLPNFSYSRVMEYANNVCDLKFLKIMDLYYHTKLVTVTKEKNAQSISYEDEAEQK